MKPSGNAATVTAVQNILNDNNRVFQTYCLFTLATFAFGVIMIQLANVLLPLLFALFLSLLFTPLIELLECKRAPRQLRECNAPCRTATKNKLKCCKGPDNEYEQNCWNGFMTMLVDLFLGAKFPRCMAIVIALGVAIGALALIGYIVAISVDEIVRERDLYAIRWARIVADVAILLQSSGFNITEDDINRTVNEFIINNVVVPISATVPVIITYTLLTIAFLLFVLASPSAFFGAMPGEDGDDEEDADLLAGTGASADDPNRRRVSNGPPGTSEAAASAVHVKDPRMRHFPTAAATTTSAAGASASGQLLADGADAPLAAASPVLRRIASTRAVTMRQQLVPVRVSDDAKEVPTAVPAPRPHGADLDDLESDAPSSDPASASRSADGLAANVAISSSPGDGVGVGVGVAASNDDDSVSNSGSRGGGDMEQPATITTDQPQTSTVRGRSSRGQHASRSSAALAHASDAHSRAARSESASERSRSRDRGRGRSNSPLAPHAGGGGPHVSWKLGGSRTGSGGHTDLEPLEGGASPDAPGTPQAAGRGSGDASPSMSGGRGSSSILHRGSAVGSGGTASAQQQSKRSRAGSAIMDKINRTTTRVLAAAGLVAEDSSSDDDGGDSDGEMSLMTDRAELKRWVRKQQRQGKMSSSREAAAIILHEQAKRRVAKYIVVHTWISIAAGVSAAIVLWILGAPLPALFGLLGVVLNFVPSIGSWVAIVLPVPVILFNQGWTKAVLALALNALVYLFYGNFLEVVTLGAVVKIDPIMIMFSILLWGYIWGIAGMVLAVPLVIIIKLIGKKMTHPIPRYIAGIIVGDLYRYTSQLERDVRRRLRYQAILHTVKSDSHSRRRQLYERHAILDATGLVTDSIGYESHAGVPSSDIVHANRAVLEHGVRDGSEAPWSPVVQPVPISLQSQTQPQPQPHHGRHPYYGSEPAATGATARGTTRSGSGRGGINRGDASGMSVSLPGAVSGSSSSSVEAAPAEAAQAAASSSSGTGLTMRAVPPAGIVATPSDSSVTDGDDDSRGPVGETGAGRGRNTMPGSSLGRSMALPPHMRVQVSGGTDRVRSGSMFDDDHEVLPVDESDLHLPPIGPPAVVAAMTGRLSSASTGGGGGGGGGGADGRRTQRPA